MKQIMFLMLMIVLATTVFAELRQIETEITISVANQTVTLETEDKDITFNCGASSPGKKTISLTRDIQCENVAELKTIASELSKNLNHSLLYYDKYLECYASERLCNMQVNGTGINYISKYEEAQENFNNCKTEKATLTSARQAAESAKSTCETEKQTMEGDKTTWGIVGAVLGVGVGYFLWGRKPAPAQSVAEQQLPKSR